MMKQKEHIQKRIGFIYFIKCELQQIVSKLKSGNLNDDFLFENLSLFDVCGHGFDSFESKTSKIHQNRTNLTFYSTK